jgi:hypothetical protein
MDLRGGGGHGSVGCFVLQCLPASRDQRGSPRPPLPTQRSWSSWQTRGRRPLHSIINYIFFQPNLGKAILFYGVMSYGKSESFGTHPLLYSLCQFTKKARSWSSIIWLNCPRFPPYASILFTRKYPRGLADPVLQQRKETQQVNSAVTSYSYWIFGHYSSPCFLYLKTKVSDTGLCVLR